MARKDRPDTVTVRGEGVRVREARDDVGAAEAHRRFGGLGIPASMLAALGATVRLGGLLTGAGSVGYQPVGTTPYAPRGQREPGVVGAAASKANGR